MADRFQMSPELRELLGELAQDDSAKLLRVPAESIWPESQEQRPHVGASAPFLKAAERKLLEVHREEAARLLYEYMTWIQREDPRFNAYSHHADCRETRPRAEVDADAKGLLQAAEGESVELEGEALLRACVASDASVSPSALLGAAMRLAPSTSIRIAQGLFRLLELDDPAGSEALLRQTLEETGSTNLASYSWENLGLLAARRGDYGEAATCYARAVRRDGSRALPKLSWLHFGLLAGRVDDCVRAAELVDRSIKQDDASLVWFSSRSAHGNESMLGQLAGRCVRNVESQLGPVSRMVANADL